MKNFKAFRRFIQKNRDKIIVKGTAPTWPYNYGTRLAYLVTINSITKYYYFNNSGILLQIKDIK